MERKKILWILLALLMVFSFGCAKDQTQEPVTTEPVVQTPAVEEPKAEPVELILATTTSTENSGLLAFLLPDFEKEYNAVVKVVAVGSGAAIEMARNAEADVLLSHAPADELLLVEEKVVPYRIELMYNDFIIVGPQQDPASIKGKTVKEALELIKNNNGIFVSRGDDSGTHKMELKLTKNYGVTFKEENYKSLGQGMGETISAANEMGGYTLTDRATYLSMTDSIDLEILVEADKDLFNQYGVMPIPTSQNYEMAENFVNWISSDSTKAKIGEFGKEEFGQSLFFPN
jgi:tungstate transport system substrate-binding protein